MSLEMTVDMSEFTGRDLIAVEKLVGRPCSRELHSGDVSAEVAYAVLTVLRRKVDPAFTLDDALDMPVDRLVLRSPAPDPTAPDS